MQQAIFDLGTDLSADQLDSLIERLNRPGDARVPAMWELAVLYAAAKTGRLRHEIELPTGRRPDIELFVPAGEGAQQISLVADITTISDEGLHDQNPIEEFASKLGRAASKVGLSPASFDYQVRGERSGRYGDGRMKLQMPRKGDLDRFFKKFVEPWIRARAESPDRPDQMQEKDENTSIVLSYMPGRQYGGGGYTSYTVAASRDKNPLFNALKSKRSQLSGAPDDVLRLVIVCDGGCDLLTSRQAGPGNFTATQVVKDFLRQNKSLDAALLIWVKTDLEFMTSRPKYTLHANLIVADAGGASHRMTQATLDALDRVCRLIHGAVPPPVKTPANAVRQSRLPSPGSDKLGAYVWNQNMVKISSRAVQRLLAGKLTPEEFNAAHDWGEAEGRIGPFERAMNDGRVISSVSVEPMEQGDDDWLIFQFGAPDPAAASFTRLPQRAASEPGEEAERDNEPRSN